MPLIIPTEGTEPDERVTVSLEQQDYDFRVRWNTKDTSWYCYVGLVNSEPSVKFKLVVGFDLLKPYLYLESVPKGALLLMDTEKQFGKPDIDNFGVEKRFQLIYFLESEL